MSRLQSARRNVGIASGYDGHRDAESTCDTATCSNADRRLKKQRPYRVATWSAGARRSEQRGTLGIRRRLRRERRPGRFVGVYPDRERERRWGRRGTDLVPIMARRAPRWAVAWIGAIVAVRRHGTRAGRLRERVRHATQLKRKDEPEGAQGQPEDSAKTPPSLRAPGLSCRADHVRDKRSPLHEYRRVATHTSYRRGLGIIPARRCPIVNLSIAVHVTARSRLSAPSRSATNPLRSH